MMNRFIKPLLTFLFLLETNESHAKVQTKTQILEDQTRNRTIPIQKYKNEDINSDSYPLVIINHGYGCLNTEYSFLGEHLAQKGYLVISIQHDLDGDPPLPRTGNLFERRLPLWKRGVENILYVMSQMQREKVILIGHSNGGDISMLFATQHPEKVDKVISLDSLRYPFPTQNNIPILSLRANDTKADEGVLPSSGATIIDVENATPNLFQNEQKTSPKFGEDFFSKDDANSPLFKESLVEKDRQRSRLELHILKQIGCKHIDMCDRGPEAVKSKIISFVDSFLNDISY